ncbi:MAG: GIY-YIG nuclease family protein [Desulfurivibrionaceae bacterium]
MSEPGFVYALINPSINGVVKVGKTTKDPSERAKELSAATGVPAPFSVAYQIYVMDCSQAEMYVHTYLEESGYRVADNREFFNAPLNIVIDAMLTAQSQINTTEHDNFVDNNGRNQTGDLAEQLYQQAENYYDGNGEVLQSYEKALAYFKKAARLGSADAHWQLGRMCFAGEGCQQDVVTALDYYEKAASLGRSDCYAIMGDIYAFTGAPHGIQNIANARKCFSKFFSSEMADCEDLASINAIHAGVYIKDVYNVNEMAQEGALVDKSQTTMPLEHLEKLKELKEEIFNYLESVIDSWSSKDVYMAKRWGLVLEYSRNVLGE